jgi:hypothetical protein
VPRRDRGSVALGRVDVLAAERRPAPRPPPVVEALAPATERPSAGLNALALATQMEL